MITPAKPTRTLNRLFNLTTTLPQMVKGERYSRKIIASLDQQELTKITKKYESDLGFQDGRKYLKAHWYIRDNVARAMMLDLHNVEKKTILDIGCGAGYFSLVCSYFGHRVIGFDLPGKMFYREMIQLFGAERFEGILQPLKPLPLKINTSFDLITAYSVTFAQRLHGGAERRWSKAEWRYFLTDVSRYLKPEGIIFLRLNIPNITGLYNRQLFSHFYDLPTGLTATSVNRREILIKKLGGLHLTGVGAIPHIGTKSHFLNV